MSVVRQRVQVAGVWEFKRLVVPCIEDLQLELRACADDLPVKEI